MKSRRLLALTAALTLTTLACKKPAPERVEATPETTAPAEVEPEAPASEPVTWDDVRAAVKDTKVDAIQRVDLLDAFIAQNPDHSEIERATALRSKYDRQAERLRRERARESDARKYSEERAAAAAEMLDGDLSALLGPLAYQSHRHTYSDRKKPTPEGFSPVEITLPTFPTVSYDKPRYLGLGNLRSSVSSIIEERLPALDAQGCSYDECQRLEINSLFAKRLGGDLMPAPSRVDPDKISALLASLSSIEPDTPLLGATAKDVYAANRLSISHFMRVHAVLQKMGEKKVRAAYDEALASSPDEMLSFYVRFSREHAITASTGLDAALADAPYVPVGFWMRRIADGSADAISSSGMKLLDKFDPAEHTHVSKLIK